jgi:thioredoxin reductase (NADPH)
VRRALDRDLPRRYAERYNVRVVDGPSAYDLLADARRRNLPVAMVLADQRDPGVDLLARTRTLHPEARCVLLTDIAHVDLAVTALDAGYADHHLVAPWDPPEERLYPALDDLLGEWAAGYRPPFQGVRVVGHRWAPDAHQIRDFFSRYQVPYQWLEVESAAEAQRVLDASGSNSEATGEVLPLVILPDGTVLRHPSLAQLADALGLVNRRVAHSFDVVIVGAGPAGLAAAVYAASEGLRAAVVDREGPGGQAALSARIENYLGFPAGVAGAELAARAFVQARRFGADLIAPIWAQRLMIGDHYRVVHLEDGRQLSAEAVVIACGIAYRRLDVPGAERLTNRGIFYGASMADAPFCAGEDVAIVGGGNSAGQAALHFAGYARSVTLLVRADSLSRGMSAYLVERIENHSGITVRTNTEVVACDGHDSLETVEVRDLSTGQTDTLHVSLLFIFIGAEPSTDWLAGVLERDEHGFLLTGIDLGGRSFPAPADGRRDPFRLETSAPGVFAAGDVRHRSLKRVASAVGEGSNAVAFVHQYLDR